MVRFKVIRRTSCAKETAGRKALGLLALRVNMGSVGGRGSLGVRAMLYPGWKFSPPAVAVMEALCLDSQLSEASGE